MTPITTVATKLKKISYSILYIILNIIVAQNWQFQRSRSKVGLRHGQFTMKWTITHQYAVWDITLSHGCARVQQAEVLGVNGLRLSLTNSLGNGIQLNQTHHSHTLIRIKATTIVCQHSLSDSFGRLWHTDSLNINARHSATPSGQSLARQQERTRQRHRNADKNNNNLPVKARSNR